PPVLSTWSWPPAIAAPPNSAAPVRAKAAAADATRVLPSIVLSSVVIAERGSFRNTGVVGLPTPVQWCGPLDPSSHPDGLSRPIPNTCRDRDHRGGRGLRIEN